MAIGMYSSDAQLQKRLAVLKKEMTKKLQEAGQYKSPQTDLVNDYKMNPDKDRIKTEIKLSSKKLKNLFSDINDTEDDLDLNSIFSEDEAAPEEDNVEKLDSVLAELDTEEATESCKACKAEDVAETEEIAESIEETSEDEPSSEVEAKMCRIARKIRSLKGKKINAELIKNLKEVEKDTESEVVSKSVRNIMTRIHNFNEEGVDEPENEEIVQKMEEAAIEETNDSVKKRLEKVAARIKALKNRPLRSEDIEDIEDSTDGSESENVVNKIGKLVNRIKKARKIKSEDPVEDAEKDMNLKDDSADGNGVEDLNSILSDEPAEDSDAEIVSNLKSIFAEDEDVAADDLNALFEDEPAVEEVPAEESADATEENNIDDVEMKSAVSKIDALSDKVNNIIEDLQTIKVNQLKQEAKMEINSLFEDEPEDNDSEEKEKEADAEKEADGPEKEGDEIISSLDSFNSDVEDDTAIEERIDSLFAEIDDPAEEVEESRIADGFEDSTSTVANEGEEDEMVKSLNSLFEDEPASEEDMTKSIKALFEEEPEIVDNVNVEEEDVNVDDLNSLFNEDEEINIDDDSAMV